MHAFFMSVCVYDFCRDACVSAWICVHAYVCVFSCLWMCVHVYVGVQMCVYTYVYVCVCVESCCSLTKSYFICGDWLLLSQPGNLSFSSEASISSRS